jgi:hypothetical protein
MIMNAAFLVEREREAEFDGVVNKVAKKYGKRLKFKYTDRGRHITSLI